MFLPLVTNPSIWWQPHKLWCKMQICSRHRSAVTSYGHSLLFPPCCSAKLSMPSLSEIADWTRGAAFTYHTHIHAYTLTYIAGACLPQGARHAHRGGSISPVLPTAGRNNSLLKMHNKLGEGTWSRSVQPELFELVQNAAFAAPPPKVRIQILLWTTPASEISTRPQSESRWFLSVMVSASPFQPPPFL